MKHLLVVAVAAVATVAAPAFSAEVGDPFDNGKPGIYNRYIIGAYPQPDLLSLVYHQPRIIESSPINRPPVYLHIPSGYARYWIWHSAATARLPDGSDCKQLLVQAGLSIHGAVISTPVSPGQGWEHRTATCRLI